MRRMMTVFIAVALVLMAATPAMAWSLGDAVDWFKGEVVAVVLTAALAVGGAVAGKRLQQITRTLAEAGEFFAVLGNAMADKRLTKEEVADIVKEGKDVFDVWRPTPARYRRE